VQCSEIGHAVAFELRRRGCPHTIATVAGHLAAVPTAYNWQGTARIAELTRRSPRTVQRARRWLEDRRLITSHVLLTGDQLEGQRSPVKHPQVVRNVERLQRGALKSRPAPVFSGRRRRKASAAEQPPASADELDELSRRAAPEYAVFFSELAAAKKKAPAKPAGVLTPLPAKDEWDRYLVEMERSFRERGPPKPPN
jgi:hypothetical protein